MSAREPIIHAPDYRMLINAGIRFPTCYAGAPLLDMDKTRLRMDGDHRRVTCKHCNRITLAAGRRIAP